MQETYSKINDLPNFDHIEATLSVDLIREFYDLITDNYNVFPTRDETSQIKICKCEFIAAIQYLTEIIHNQ